MLLMSTTNKIYSPLKINLNDIQVMLILDNFLKTIKINHI